MPPVGQPPRDSNGETPGRDLLRFAGARRIHDDLGRIGRAHERQHALAVGREGLGAALSQPHRRRTVQRAQVDRIAFSAALARFAEEHEAAVGGDVGQKAPVEPAQVDLLRIGGAARENADLSGVVRDQDAPVPRHVLQRQRSGDAGERAGLARQRGGMENAVAADLRRRVPDLRAVGRPGEPVRRRVDRARSSSSSRRGRRRRRIRRRR